MNRREYLKSMGFLSAGLLLYRCKTETTSDAHFKEITLSYRLHPELWSQPFNSIEKGLLQYISAINEIAMFDESLNHRRLLSLHDVEQSAALLKQRIVDFKNAGIPQVGINVYDDIGVRNFDGGYTFDYRPLVGHDGKQSGWCPCPNDENLHNYLLEKLKMYAAASPDFIWIDDDYRNANRAGIRYSCFCPDCMQRFGQSDNQESLVKQLNQPENQALRQQWMQFMNDTMNQLALKIKHAIKDIDPDIEIGFMTVGYDLSTYAYDFPTWMQTMQAVKARPGHGYYHEDEPRLIKNKIFDVARQVRDYPAITTDIQYELEDWSYTTLNKSVQTEMNESLLSLMAGCTGVAYNAIYANEWEEKTRMLDAIALQKPLWDKVNDMAAEMPLVGFWPVDHPQLMSKLEVGENGWFRENYDIQLPNELAEMGVPFCFTQENSQGALLSGRLVEGFDNNELKNMLSASVYLDAEALDILWHRGLGAYTGVKHQPERFTGVEVLLDHPFNGNEVGDGRRPGAWGSGSTLQSLDKQVQPLSKLQTMKGEDKGNCLTAYENELGGRVAVSSYFAWNDFGRAGKRNQMMNLINWLSKDRIPLKINSLVRLLPLIRMSADRSKFLLALFNSSYDHLNQVPVQVRSEGRQVMQLTPQNDREIKADQANGWLQFEIKEIKPWQVIMIAGL
ncbi:MAG: hypothetical protein ACNS62_08855 [Candidatus Cyclobacteriaceae bacterium M3_2C_046]